MLLCNLYTKIFGAKTPQVIKPAQYQRFFMFCIILPTFCYNIFGYNIRADINKKYRDDESSLYPYYLIMYHKPASMAPCSIVSLLSFAASVVGVHCIKYIGMFWNSLSRLAINISISSRLSIRQTV